MMSEKLKAMAVAFAGFALLGNVTIAPAEVQLRGEGSDAQETVIISNRATVPRRFEVEIEPRGHELGTDGLILSPTQFTVLPNSKFALSVSAAIPQLERSRSFWLTIAEVVLDDTMADRADVVLPITIKVPLHIIPRRGGSALEVSTDPRDCTGLTISNSGNVFDYGSDYSIIVDEDFTIPGEAIALALDGDTFIAPNSRVRIDLDEPLPTCGKAELRKE